MNCTASNGRPELVGFGVTMMELFEHYPVTESLLLWYPTVILAAELTLHHVQYSVEHCVGVQHQLLPFAMSAFFMTAVNLETWHFMVLYVETLPQRNLVLALAAA